MSNMSSGSSNARKGGGSCIGIPKKCWCDAGILTLISKSQANPNRKYFRCSYAASHKLIDDNHIFKWVNDVVADKVMTMSSEIERLKRDVSDIRAESVVLQRMVVDKVEELSKNVKIACGVVLVGCVFVGAMMKLV